MRARPIYLDHHATTPVDPRVLEAMLPALGPSFGNAASTSHVYGTEARERIEEARGKVARLVGARAADVVFTSGATEANNLAVLGVARASRARGRHVVTQKTEHRAVLDPCKQLEREGFEVTYVDVDEEGRVDPGDIGRAIRADTVLVSIMRCNNEVGTVQDVAAIGAIARESDVPFHSDGAQGLGLLALDVRAAGIDLLSLSAHKVGGPKGVGALVLRGGPRGTLRIEPIVYGGGHEGGLRSGTSNVPGIVGFGRACAILRAEGAEEATRLAGQRDLLAARITSSVDGVWLQGAPPPDRHPGNLHLAFDRVDGPTLLVRLAERLAVSSGAACSTAEPGPSHVLEAMRIPAARAKASIRFGLGRTTTDAEIEEAASFVVETVRVLRGIRGRAVKS